MRMFFVKESAQVHRAAGVGAGGRSHGEETAARGRDAGPGPGRHWLVPDEQGDHLAGVCALVPGHRAVDGRGSGESESGAGDVGHHG